MNSNNSRKKINKTIRITEEDYKLISNNAKSCNMCVGDYIVRLVKNKGVGLNPNVIAKLNFIKTSLSDPITDSWYKINVVKEVEDICDLLLN